MRVHTRLSCILALVAGLIVASDAAARSAADFRKLLREWTKRADDPDKLRKEIEKLKKQREKQRKKETQKKRKEDAKLSLKMIKEAFDKGKEAYDEKRYSEAYLYFEDVAGSRHPGTTGMVDQAKTKLAEIDGMARARVEQARIMLLQRRRVDAAVTLQHVVANFPFCAVAREARTRLRALKSSPSVAAAVRFSEGKAQETAGNYVDAYGIYEDVVRRWPYQLGAEEARRAMRDLRADEEKFEAIRAAKDEEIEGQCTKRLLKARNFLANRMPGLARPEIDWILKNAPGTSFAEEAEGIVSQMEAAPPADDAERDEAAP